MNIIVGRCLLQDILDRKNIERTEFIEMSGMSKQSISNYVTGVSIMSLKTAYKISYLLDCDIVDLYEWHVN